jgi:hypothetical protein
VRWTLLLLSATVVFAQSGTDPKSKAEDYEVHGQSKYTDIGAEFMVHSFSGQGTMYIAKDYLVVEVALFPVKGGIITVSGSQFALRVNGKKIAPAPPRIVSQSLQHPDWQTGPHLEGGAGLGNTGVILGRPRPTQVPPSGPGEPQSRVPTQPRVPGPGIPDDIQSEPRLPAHELLAKTALPEGPFRGPVSGFLYFPYKGKTSSIKALELLYEDAVIKLQ